MEEKFGVEDIERRDDGRGWEKWALGGRVERHGTYNAFCHGWILLPEMEVMAVFFTAIVGGTHCNTGGKSA